MRWGCWRYASKLFWLAAFCSVSPALPVAGQERSLVAGMALIETQKDSASEYGSGFMVGKSGSSAYIVTAQHVIADYRAIKVIFAVAPDSPSSAKVVMQDDRLDLVVLLADAAPAQAQAVPIQLARQPGLGEQLYLIGYSVGNRSPAIRTAGFAQEEGAEWMLQTQVDEMDSGGPVIYQGAVAGWTKKKEGGYARCGSAATLAAALRGWKVPFTPTASAPPAAPRSSAGPPAGGSGAGNSCGARIVSATGGSKQVFQGASRSSPVAGSLSEGARVTLIGQRYSDGKLWYRISSSERNISGYLPQTDLRLDGNCPKL